MYALYTALCITLCILYACNLVQHPVLLNPDTPLGSFGPGADPKRRRAASPPPRLARTWQQNGANNLSKSRPGGVPHRTLGPKIDQILILGALVALGLSWWRLGSVLGACWDRLERLLGPNLGPKMDPSWQQNGQATGL